ncbi:MAG: Zn-dependent alcohol dehydrogenase [Armatimonadota bacterium]
MKTPAAVLYGLNQPFVVEEVELDPPGSGEVLVEMAGGGICHSDWHVVDGVIPKPQPIILGHEGSARVLECGPNVSLVKAGDPVVLSFLPECGACYQCMRGKANLCDGSMQFRSGVLADGTTRFHRNGTRIHHYNGVSSFAQYAVVPERACVPIDPRVPLDKAALIGCAVSTGVGAVIFSANVLPGSTMAVFGAGGVGLNTVQGGALVNATRVIAVDVNPNKLAMARQFGATDTVDAREQDPVQAILELTGGRGVDYAFEAIGRPETVRQAFESLGKGGTAVAIGIGSKDACIEIPPQHLVYGERRLVGCFYGSARPRADFARFADLYLAGRLKLDQLVTREWGLSEINEAFRAMNAGEVARGIINRYTA